MSSHGYLNEDEMYNIHDKNARHVMKNFQDARKITGPGSSGDYEAKLRNTLEQHFQNFIILNERNQTGVSQQLDELIQVITRNQENAAELNASRTQMIMDLINTFKASGDTHAHQIRELTVAFNSNRRKGFDFMDFLVNTIMIIPKTLKYFSRMLR